MSSSSYGTIVTREASDSNSRNETCRGSNTNRRRRSDQEVHSGKYKGVVIQQNGNWGAQIYFNNERIWLGTFKSEKEAGMAYDSAALKLRNGDSDRNFPWTNLTMHEPQFQSQFTTEAVLNMIKDGSYLSRLANYASSQGKVEVTPHNYAVSENIGGEKFVFKELFKKELTPSDVGKLNRLVIPKKSALKFFPPIPEDEVGKGTEEVQLTFHDRSMKLWKFRYCYWKSSQSFVFTRGWNRFVSVNNLQAKDIIIFSQCEFIDSSKNEVSVFHVIEVIHKNGGDCYSGIAVEEEEEEDNVDEMLTYETDTGDVNEEEEYDNGEVEEKSLETATANLIDSLDFNSTSNSVAEDDERSALDGDKEIGRVDEEKKKVFRLFGVQIL